MTDNQIRHIVWVEFNRNEGKNVNYTFTENKELRSTTFNWMVDNNNLTKTVEWKDYENLLNENEEDAENTTPLESNEDIKNEEIKIVSFKQMSDIVWGRDPKEISYTHDENHHKCKFEGITYIAYLKN